MKHTKNTYLQNLEKLQRTVIDVNEDSVHEFAFNFSAKYFKVIDDFVINILSSTDKIITAHV